MLRAEYRTIVCYALLLAASFSYSQSPFLIDSVVGPSAHFEVLPQTVKQTCKKALGLQMGVLRVYAHVRSGEFEYYAVFDEGLKDDEYYGGSILEVHGSACAGSDLEGILANQVRAFRPLEDDVVFRKFVRDAIQRDVKAHGGDAQYRPEACKQSVEARLQQAGYAIVHQELKAYCDKESGAASSTERK